MIVAYCQVTDPWYKPRQFLEGEQSKKEEKAIVIAMYAIMFRQFLFSLSCARFPFFDIIIYRVPLGFVCGYPLQGGELYGGSMFARSAAADTLQGQAMQRVNERFGSDSLGREGRESLGMAVCKKKYTPFSFPMITAPDGTVQVSAERRLGCRAHHGLRQTVVAQHGMRPGWEPFGQWTYKKANDLARKDTAKRNRKVAAAGDCTTTEDEVSLSSAEDAAVAVCANPNSSASSSSFAANNFRSLCWNGNCLVRHESMYDDVEAECRQRQAAADAAAAADAKKQRQDTKRAATTTEVKRVKR